MGKSIGFKVNTLPIVLGVIFVAAILCDIGAIKNIGQKSDQIAEVYLKLEKEHGSVEVAFEQTKLYANLTMIYAGQEMGGVFAQVLSDCNTTMLDHLDNVGTLCKKAEDPALTDAYIPWQSQLNDYSGHVAKILDAANAGDAAKLGEYVGQIQDYHESVSDASAAFQEILNTQVDNAIKHMNIKIHGTIVFDMILVGIFVALILGSFLFVSKAIAGPAKLSGRHLQDIITGIKNNEGDLTARIPVRTSDEIGQMSAGVNGFIEQLQNVMKSLKAHASSMADSADIVNREIADTNESANSMSAVTEQMSASMEEISATLNSLAGDSAGVMGAVDEMTSQVDNGVQLVDDIKTRADELHQTTVESKESTEQIVQKIRTALNRAFEESKSVERINALTGDILDISSQTNLLSLNASIEAARAGEAGRGFAVVADEIRVLADNSANTASDIQHISEQVIGAVEQLAKSAEEMLQFVDTKIMKDYDSFVGVMEQYEADAGSVDEILNEFAKNSRDINRNVKSMNDGINNITTAVDESARGITEVAQTAGELVNSIRQIQKETDSNREISAQLNSEVSRFKNV